MNQFYLTILRVLAGVAIIATLWILLDAYQSKIRQKEETSNRQKIENELKASNRLLEQRLGTSETQRMVLDHAIDSINNRNRVLVRATVKLDSTLKSVKGRYKDRTTSELENEMIKRWQER